MRLSGTTRGFRIYTTDPFSKCFETKQGDIALLEMLFSTSLVALILSPRRLQITNTKVRQPVESGHGGYYAFPWRRMHVE